MNKQKNDFWGDNVSKSKHKKVGLYIFGVAILIGVFTGGVYVYAKIHRSHAAKQSSSTNKIVNISNSQPVSPTPVTPTPVVAQSPVSTPPKKITQAIPKQSVPTTVNQATQLSEHFVTFYYKNYTCSSALGNKSYEIIDYLIGDGGSTWNVSDNTDTSLCSRGEYLLFSISRSSIAGSKSIFFKPFDKYPPDYADDSDGDLITIKYDLNKTKIESVTYLGY